LFPDQRWWELWQQLQGGSDRDAAALAAIDTITGTSKLLPQALQRGEPHAQQQGQLGGTRPVSKALIQDQQSLLAINMGVSRPRPLPRRPESFLRP
jgi:hypothetical protein